MRPRSRIAPKNRSPGIRDAGVRMPPADPSTPARSTRRKPCLLNSSHLETFLPSCSYNPVAPPPTSKPSSKAVDIVPARRVKKVTMAPYPASNTSSLNMSPPNPPHPTAFQLSAFNQNQWSPDAIGTLVFGFVMFFIGVTALWQGRLRTLSHEEGTFGLCPFVFLSLSLLTDTRR